MNKNIAFFEGKFVNIEDAKISIKTHAFLYGTSVFEGIRAYWNEDKKSLFIFRPLEHFLRLKNSVKIMRMDLERSPEELIELIKELLRKNFYTEDTYIRPGVYKAAMKIGPSLLNNPSEFYMFTLPMGDYIDTQKAVSVCTSNWRRLEDASIPIRSKVAGGYVNTALAKSEAQLNGFADCIMLDDRGHVCEGSAMNLFMVRNGKLITSPLSNNVLEGITRDSIIEIAEKELGISVIERQIDRSELFIADEVFFCGTGAQVSAIGNIDHYKIGNGEMGEITKKIQELYFDIVRGKVARYSHWCVNAAA